MFILLQDKMSLSATIVPFVSFTPQTYVFTRAIHAFLFSIHWTNVFARAICALISSIHRTNVFARAIRALLSSIHRTNVFTMAIHPVRYSPLSADHQFLWNVIENLQHCRLIKFDTYASKLIPISLERRKYVRLMSSARKISLTIKAAWKERQQHNQNTNI